MLTLWCEKLTLFVHFLTRELIAIMRIRCLDAADFFCVRTRFFVLLVWRLRESQTVRLIYPILLF